MYLHRFFIFVLIIMALYTLNLDWFHHSYNLNSISPFGTDTSPSKTFLGELFLYEICTAYTLLSLFIVFIPKRLFLTTIALRVGLCIIGLQMILGLAIIIIQSDALTISSFNTAFILFLMVNLALIRRMLSFWSAAVSNNKYVDENVLD